MMNKPYIDELSEKGESRYTLIAVAAKRARQITENNPELSRSGAINPVSQALHEINDDKLQWHHRSNVSNAAAEVLVVPELALTEVENNAGEATENRENSSEAVDADVFGIE